MNPFRFASVTPPTDPDFANVSLLLHMDGTDGSSTFIDNSPNAFTVTAHSNAQIDTALSKFGGASGLFGGGTDHISVADNAAFAFGSGNFSIECFLYWPGTSSGFWGILGKRSTSAVYGPFTFGVDASNGRPAFYASTSGSSWNVALAPATALTVGIFNYLNVRRTSNLWELSLNGTTIASQTVSGSLVTNSSRVRIGVSADDFAFPLISNLDELRITKNVSRPITVPTEAFPNS